MRRPATGSSPRMRGTPPRRHVLRRASRFIPAHAGNSTALSTAASLAAGSSPRMRGTLCHLHGSGRLDRFIPAHAGNSPSTPCSLSMDTGSSPRMRGTHDSGNVIGVRDRFIPAHAGNSQGVRLPCTRPTVHPRACGELSIAGLSAGVGCGSSPRMRGTPIPLGRLHLRQRFIPAHAGNSRDHIARSGTSAVHPRACGELERGHGEHVQPVGSSPRMRGTRRMGRFDSRPRRFIPAHAGNSKTELTDKQIDAGSSPRMRGTLRPLYPLGWSYRFIPAHAGNSLRA